jgi:phospholipid/cholesterol/gamma-HCH transport system substrate-binding protein
MESKTLAAKVGFFVLLGLVLIGALLLNFSKGAAFWSSGRVIIVKSGNVGGLREGAAVTMSGVRVGSVEKVSLSQDGRTVQIHCRIESEVAIHRDARFDIEQSGFLGDQYIAIIPMKNAEPPLKDQDVVRASEPFNLQEAARGAVGLMNKLDAAATKIDSAIGRVDRVLLSEASLTELTNTISNLRRMSESADRTLVEVEGLVLTNKPAISSTLSNLNAFSLKLSTMSDQLGALATNIDSVVSTNRETLRETLLSLRDASESFKGITTDLQSGKGAVGALLKDEKLQVKLTETFGNLATVSSNLAKHGLLWTPKRTTPLTNDTRYSGRGPLR